MEFKKSIIDTLLSLPLPYRVEHIFDYAKITKTEVATRHGCSIVNAAATIRGNMQSIPVKQSAYALLQERLGELCPTFEAVFGHDAKTAA